MKTKIIAFCLIFTLALPGCFISFPKGEANKSEQVSSIVYWGTTLEVKTFLDSPEAAKANKWFVQSLEE